MMLADTFDPPRLEGIGRLPGGRFADVLTGPDVDQLATIKVLRVRVVERVSHAYRRICARR
jgi:hypothetical protein